MSLWRHLTRGARVLVGRRQLEAETSDWSRRAGAVARLLKAEG